jgi:hypothetical protein
LTGQYYDNSLPFHVFIKQAYAQHSVTKYLKDSGYRVSVFPAIAQTMYLDESIASNITKDRFLKAIAIAPVYEIAWFRYMPYPVKKLIYARQSWVFTPGTRYDADLTFMQDMARRSTVGFKDNAFFFYHLRVPHPPHRLNAQLHYEELPDTRDGYVAHAKAALKLIQIFLSRLNVLGIYDKSLIVIVADHGWDIDIRPAGLPGMPLDPGAPKGMPRFPSLTCRRRSQAN